MRNVLRFWHSRLQKDAVRKTLGFLFSLWVTSSAFAATIYVDASRPDDSGSGTNWATAKRTIQAGVDIATGGATVLVADGTYAVGGQVAPGGSLLSRVVITNAITVRSVNGAAATAILGSGTNAYGTVSAIRCVYMSKGTLDGFTLRDGTVSAASSVTNADGSGGAVYAVGTTPYVQNCVFAGNKAYLGGGTCYGTQINCTLTGNMATYGGGICYGTQINCTLTGNTATYGGGICYGTQINCTLLGNSATYGGGTSFSTQNNCTLTGNTATYGGGIYSSTKACNCIVWGNRKSGGGTNDVSGGLYFFTCASDVALSSGCVRSNPLFVNAANGDVRLQAGSPCIDKGYNVLAASYPDLDGLNRIADGNGDGTATVDMGAYEYNTTNVIKVTFEPACGTPPTPLTREITFGQAYGSLATTTRSGYTFGGWWTERGGVGSQVTAGSTVSLAYNHAVYAKWTPDTSRILYVSANRADDSGDGLSWETAKHTIQAGVDEAADGETVWVTNGIYTVGGTVAAGWYLSNRVSIAKSVSVRSVNGPAVTVIEGSGTNAYGTVFSMRCVYMTKGSLEGFTLRGGATQSNGGGNDLDGRGGGFYASTMTPQVKNCILEGNRADHGGGAYEGTLINCILTGNMADSYGGGSRDSTLNNCLLTGNAANLLHGGGACSSYLNNCTLSGNTAAGNGGGAYDSTIRNCIIWDNRKTAGATSDIYDSGSHPPFYTCASGLAETNGCVSTNPLFVNGALGDFRLQAGSPCIDRGSNTYAPTGLDLDGHLRIFDGDGDGTATVDMGAFEAGSIALVLNTLTVSNGTGGGSYTNGQWVTIIANTPSAGQRFDRWTGAAQYVASVTSSPTIVTMPASNIAVTATYVTINDADFTLKTNADNTVTITGYTGAGGAVTIPSTLGGRTISSIGNYAFYLCRTLTAITIPNSVTNIGSSAFFTCSSLPSIVIPASVVSIGPNVFDGCSALKTITVDAANLSYSSVDGVLFNKSQTVLIQCPGGRAGNYTAPAGVTSVGSYAFTGCYSLTGVTIPAGVTSIGSCAFYECLILANVTIPASVTNIGTRVFYRCYDLPAITVDAANPSYSDLNGVLLCKSPSTLIVCPGGKAGTVAIPVGVISIEPDAFSGCPDLTGVTIPASVTSIGSMAFFYCPALKTISVDAANLSYSSVDDVLYNKSQTALIVCPGGKAGTVAIPDSVTSVSSYSFCYCSGLTSVSIPAGVTIIGEQVFFLCSGLTSITIPAGVTSIGSFMFHTCSSLTSITIPAGVTSIGSAAFYNCTGLTNVYFNGNAPSLGSSAFSGANNATVYRLSGASGWPVVPNAWGGRPTALWSPVYLLTVNNGTGSGSYTNGQQVAIAANAPLLGQRFDRWTGATQYVASVTAANTVVTMPASAIAVSATFVADTKTLTVVSAQGGEQPGTVSADYDTALSQFVTNSPILNGATQYVCMAGTVAGNAFTQVSPTNVTLTLTNTATLTWQWQTQYRLTTGTNGNGTVTAGGWCIAGSNATLTANAAANWHFAGWSGDTNGCAIAGNSLTAPMTQARAIAASFDINVYTLTVNGGTGGGSYTNGQIIAIAANTPTLGQRFDQWIGATQYVANVTASNTVVCMPAYAIFWTNQFRRQREHYGILSALLAELFGAGRYRRRADDPVGNGR